MEKGKTKNIQTQTGNNVLSFSGANTRLKRIVYGTKNIFWVLFDFLTNCFKQSDLSNPKNILPKRVSVCAIVPSYKPGELTVNLVKDIVRWNEEVTVCVVDDCTPKEYEKEHKIFSKIKKISSRVRVLRTPENRMKAGALNHAIQALSSDPSTMPEVIITLDDDVVINKNTIKELVDTLVVDARVGASCSQCRVLNKNKNIITRLQGLEYLGYNAVRIADESFYHGPLVMHGMLTAFRTKAILEAGLFAERHLIEDYEITARLKLGGWRVRLAPTALAWTEVPETFGALWRQRARWINGGLLIVGSRRYWRAIPQDLIGHGMFLSMLLLIVAFVALGHSTKGVGELNPITSAIIALSVGQALLLLTFQVWYMKFYAERDRLDWVIRFSLIPEFLYANTLTLVLLGAYVFRLFESFANKVPKKSGGIMYFAFERVRLFFQQIGYTSGWGTRGS